VSLSKLGNNCNASRSPANEGMRACANAEKGRLPGVERITLQPWGSVGRSPALKNEFLPAPDGPMRARSRGLFSFFQTDSTSSSRPKKYSASSSANEARPG
jgi:hypothetical protein